MSETNLFHRCLLALAGMALVLTGCSNDDGASQKVNGSVHIAAGVPSGPADTVNGNVTLADDATATTAHTVNGGIDLGAHAAADTLSTVNGNITLGAGARVAQGAQSVNGGVALGEGAEILGAVRNVNGKIRLAGAHVGGGIETVNGNITIVGASRVEGGILVKKSSGISIHFSNDVPRIEIGPGATVQGDLRFEREVKLYVSDRAAIGPVSGTTPISFSGDSPPAG
jgi:DUF4097 and DUF4098 domain-containing protein YvlB